MNPDNIKRWTQELRTTDLPQAQDHLCSGLDDHGNVGYCCLGVGTRLTHPNHPWLEPNAMGLAPYHFIEWLGMKFNPALDTDQIVETGWDVEIDVPPEIDFADESTATPTGATLNDAWGLTFAQIADMIDYFGLKEQAAR